jgi:hypothetical protein
MNSKPDIAFLHTSPVHVPTFEKLMREVAPGLKATHAVREDLLADALRDGADNAALGGRIRKAMADAGASGAPVVVCTCSTIGGVAESVQADAFSATRIDRAMADRAVGSGKPILLVAALESTLGPTRALLHSSADRMGVTPSIESLVVKGAWAHFISGDQARYIESIVEAIVGADAASSTVVLAQASMAPAAPALGKLGITALSSPRLGVEHAVALHGEVGK